MAEVNYVEVRNIEVDTSEIRCEVDEVLEICERNDISLSDLVNSYFQHGANDEYRTDLIFELQSMGRSTEIDLDTVKEWIREQWNISVLTDALLTVTETLARRAEALSR